ncbi:MAG: hypothetical protein N2491_08495, partial [Negativicutes bacterium]|nr:hypothetical protein [Negativicutes bacterium]
DNVGNNGRLTLGGGSYYRSGDLVFGNNAVISGEGIIYVAGNVIFENNVSFTGRVFIIAEGDINVGNGVTIHNGVLHSPRNINLGNNSNIAGSAVAGGVINVHNNAVITYNQSVVQHFGLGGTTTLNINSWGNQ